MIKKFTSLQVCGAVYVKYKEETKPVKKTVEIWIILLGTAVVSWNAILRAAVTADYARRTGKDKTKGEEKC